MSRRKPLVIAGLIGLVGAMSLVGGAYGIWTGRHILSGIISLCGGIAAIHMCRYLLAWNKLTSRVQKSSIVATMGIFALLSVVRGIGDWPAHPGRALEDMVTTVASAVVICLLVVVGRYTDR